MNELFEPLVLHVEDNVDDEMLVKRALRNVVASKSIVSARDGREAFGFLFEKKPLGGMTEHRLPDLILLDLKLPIMGGLELLEKLRATEETRAIPVVVLTSSDEHRDVERCYQLGANSYVSKPVDFEKFTETVQSIGNYWLETNRTPRSSASFVDAMS